MHACEPGPRPGGVGHGDVAVGETPEINGGQHERRQRYQDQGKFDGGQADGHGSDADLGRRAGLLADPERGVEQLVKHDGAAAHAARDPVRIPHLGEDLGLALHHRFEPGGDAVEAADGVVIEADLKQGGVEPVRAADSDQLPDQGAGELGRGAALDLPRVQFGAVARAQEHGLGHVRPGEEFAEGLLAFGAVEGQALARRDRGGFMVDADHHETHCVSRSSSGASSPSTKRASSSDRTTRSRIALRSSASATTPRRSARNRRSRSSSGP